LQQNDIGYTDADNDGKWLNRLTVLSMRVVDDDWPKYLIAII